MTTTKSTKTAPKVTAPKGLTSKKIDAMKATKETPLAYVTLWENLKDTSPEAMESIGEAVAWADNAIEGAPIAYALRCAEIASAIMYGPRGTTADIIKGVAKGKGISLGAAKIAVVRYQRAGRILVTQPQLDPLAVRKFLRDAKVEDVTRAIETGELSAPAPKAPAKGKGGAGKSRGAGKSSAKDVTLRAQVIATTQANTKCITMAKVPAEIPVEELKLLKASLEATLKAVDGMLTVATPAKVAKVVA